MRPAGSDIRQTPERDASVSNEFTVNVLAVNDPPGSFDLISPEDGYDQIDRETFVISFEWAEASDVEGDILTYTHYLQVVYGDLDEIIIRTEIEAIEYTPEDLRSTLTELGLFSEDTLKLEATWWVEANDGELSTESSERRTLIIPVPLSANGHEIKLPSEFTLYPTFPNPFNNSTTITYSLPHPGNVSLQVYNLSGQRITTLFEGFKQAGIYTSNLTADNLPSGLYFVRLKASDQVFTQKVMLIR